MIFIRCEDVVQVTIMIDFTPPPRFVRVVALWFVPAFRVPKWITGHRHFESKILTSSLEPIKREPTQEIAAYPHSFLRARIGSTAADRRAGIQQATSASTISKPATAIRLNASTDFTP